MSSIYGFPNDSNPSIGGWPSGNSGNGTGGNSQVFQNITVTSIASITQAVINTLSAVSATIQTLTVTTLVILNNLDFPGNVTIDGTLTAAKNTTIGTQVLSALLFVYGNIQVTGTINSTNLNLTGNLNATNADFSNTLECFDFNADEAEIGELLATTFQAVTASIVTLSVTGETEFAGNVTVTGAVEIVPSLLVTGTVDVVGVLTATEIVAPLGGTVDIQSSDGIVTAPSNTVTPGQLGILSNLSGHLATFIPFLATDNTFTGHNYQTSTIDKNTTTSMTTWADVTSAIYTGGYAGESVYFHDPRDTGAQSNRNWYRSFVWGVLVNDGNHGASESIVMGNQASYVAQTSASIVMGPSCLGDGPLSVFSNSVAIGPGIRANASVDSSVGLGASAVITKSHQIVLGTANEVITVPNATEYSTVHLPATVTGTGTIDYWMPQVGVSYKKIIIVLGSMQGTCTITFPVAFTGPPVMVGISPSLAPSDISSLTATDISINNPGASKSGIFIFEGF